MPETKRGRPGLNARLRRWETILVVVFLADFCEDKILFKASQIPAWGKIVFKMALVVGLLGILLGLVNRHIDRGVATAHAISGRAILPKVATHALLLGAVFVGYYWLKIGRFPWS
jgi:hypothetical protein